MPQDLTNQDYVLEQQVIAYNKQALVDYSNRVKDFQTQVKTWTENAQHYYDLGQSVPPAPQPPQLVHYIVQDGQIKETLLPPTLSVPQFVPAITLQSGSLRPVNAPMDVQQETYRLVKAIAETIGVK